MKILIADDHTIVRKGVKMLLTENFPFTDITDVSDSVELMKMVLQEKWNIIISDISMPPGESGIDTIKKIKQYAPGTPVLILTMHPAKEYAVKAIKAGASGYLSKSADTKEFIKAVGMVLSGSRYLNPEVSDIMADAFINDNENRSVDKLSNREFEVFKLMSAGKSLSQIADDIFLSTNTISTFRAKIFEKMGFQNNLELIKYAVDNKLV
ncbi:MAG: response regulator transcription factor [Bacteroidota bacterium]